MKTGCFFNVNIQNYEYYCINCHIISPHSHGVMRLFKMSLYGYEAVVLLLINSKTKTINKHYLPHSLHTVSPSQAAYPEVDSGHP